MARLRQKSGPIRYIELLVDSGADYTTISRSTGLRLGLDYQKIQGSEIKLEVANLTFFFAKKVNLLISINGHEFPIPVLIAKVEVEDLLGRKGVFNHYDVLFQENQQQVTFTNAWQLPDKPPKIKGRKAANYLPNEWRRNLRSQLLTQL